MAQGVYLLYRFIVSFIDIRKVWFCSNYVSDQVCKVVYRIRSLFTYLVKFLVIEKLGCNCMIFLQMVIVDFQILSIVLHGNLQSHSPINHSVRRRNFMSVLPSSWQPLQTN